VFAARKEQKRVAYSRSPGGFEGGVFAEESLDFRSLTVLEPKNVEDDLHDRYLATATDKVKPHADDEGVVGFMEDFFGRPMPALHELSHARGPLPDAIVPPVDRGVRNLPKLTKFDVLSEILKPSLDVGRSSRAHSRDTRSRRSPATSCTEYLALGLSLEMGAQPDLRRHRDCCVRVERSCRR
jgi:hypothetical protein